MPIDLSPEDFKKDGASSLAGKSNVIKLTPNEMYLHAQAQAMEGNNNTISLSPEDFKKPTGPQHFEEGPSDIAGSEQYIQEEGWLDSMLGALDYADNISRSGILGYSRGKALKYMREAALKKRYTSPTVIKDLATNKMGIGKVRFGLDDERFQVGDIADYALDLATDIATSPLSMASFGINKALKGSLVAAKLAKTAKVMEGVPGTAMAVLSKAAKNADKMDKYGAPLVGGIYAAGLPEKDAPWEKRLFAALGGAAAVVGGKRILPYVRNKAGTTADWLTDAYATYSRNSDFRGYSIAHNTMRGARDKWNNIATWIQQGRFKAIEGLEPEEVAMVESLMHDIKNHIGSQRKEIMKIEKIKDGSKDFQLLTDSLVKEVSAPGGFVEKILQGQDDKIIKAIGKWADHNDDVIKRLNKETYGLENGLYDASTNRGIVGLRWHIDDEVLGKVQAKRIEKMFGAIKMKSFKSGKTMKNPLPSDLSYKRYAEKFARNFVNDQEREALKLLSKYEMLKPRTKTFEAIETIAKGYDKFNNFVKGNLLYFSLTWLKNNYWDNMAKAFTEGGMPAFFDAASLGTFQKGLRSDIFDLYGNKMNRVFKSHETAEMLHLGVLDNPLFRAMRDDDVIKALKNPTSVGQAIQNKSIFEKWTDGLAMTTGRFGSYMEGMARATTYMRMRDSFVSTPVFKKLVKEMGEEKAMKLAKETAASISRKTFFDYGNVSTFERATLKRFFPFYSFYSKNLPYWMKATVSPEKMGRILAVEKIRRNIGADPTYQEKQGMMPYLSENAPRQLGRDSDGNKVYGILPSSSFHDAIKMIETASLKDQAIEKMSPLLKTPTEMALNMDFFSGGPLYPSGEKTKRKYLFSRGHKYKAIGDALVAAGLLEDNPVKIDRKGNVVTGSDKLVGLDKIASTVFPHGFVDQLVGSLGKVETGRETWEQAFLNRIAPIQTVKVSPVLERTIRSRTMRKKLKERLEEALSK